MENVNKPFRIGLCMAGAVSAGAYTAGVMDYLIEALDAWEKKRGEANIPSHKVVIPIMGGASAGGMTAILAAGAINNHIKPIAFPTPEALLNDHPENKLYTSWVDLLQPEMLSKMLETSDIQKGKVQSLLNSDFIDTLANKVICCTAENWQPSFPFFEMPVKVFTTLSNLEGFKYNTDFNSARQKSKYNMSVHNDYACFEVFDGITKKESQSGWIPLNFRTDQNVHIARDAAMATGAFPIGLKARTLQREAQYVYNVPWLKKYFDKDPVHGDVIKTLNIDGGMINNEPFEKVRELLDDISNKETPMDKETLNQFNTNYNTFENTVLMVDPFPSSDPEPFTFDNDITNVIGKTLSAMTSQMRAKPIEYRTAMEMVDASQFIISPARELRDKKGTIIKELFGENAIASGAMGGFSGFLSKEFRIHDYYLGRHNCEIFLRDYFTIPAEAVTKNEIFANGYALVDKNLYASMATGDLRYQIIPIFTPRPAPGTLPMPIFSSGSNWPSIPENFIDGFDKPLRNRVEKVVLNLANLKGITNFLVVAGAKIVLNKLFAKKIREAMKDALRKWHLVQ